MVAAVEKPSDFGDPPTGTTGRWLAEIRAYEKTFESWTKKVERVVKRYRNEHSVNEPLLTETDPQKRFNILWSNVQTLQPAIYSRMPLPDITRKHKDRDPVARAAAVILERAVRDQIETGGFDAAMRSARDDYLLAARGQARVRYVPTYGEEQRDKIFLQQDTAKAAASPPVPSTASPEGSPPSVAGEAAAPTYAMPDGSAPPDDAEVQNDPDGKPFIEHGEPYRPVVAECVKQEHSAWSDFGHTPAPSWGRVRACWWREMMTRDQLIERFGKEKGNKVSLTKLVPNVTTADAEQYGDAFKRGEVFEIWDRTAGQVLWISSGLSEPLDAIKDPLHLEGFFPCPPPFYGTLTSDSLVPVTDYDEYRSQAEEIDTLTQRIALLAKALKIAGAYDGSVPALGKIFNSPETDLVAVDNWALFAEKGGIAGAISFVPTKEVAETILALTNIRAAMKQDIQEITGISDIVRGQSDPNETLGAQQIKRQFVGMRIKDRQDGMERFARDMVRLVAEIVAEQFSAETLWEISGWQHTEEAREADKAAKAAQPPMPPMMGHNGGPPMMADGSMPPVNGGGPVNPVALPLSASAPMAGPPSLPMAPMASGGSPNGMGDVGASPMMPLPPSALPVSLPSTAMSPPPPTAGGASESLPLDSRGLFAAAIELIKSDRLRGYNVSIETDSMVLQDQQAEKQQGIEFVTAISGFLKEAVPAAATYPDLKEPLGELLLFGIRQFKAGTQLEAVFEQFIDKGSEPQPQQPDPAAMEAQLKAQSEAAKIEIEKGRLALEQQKAQVEGHLAQLKVQIEDMKARSDAALKSRALDIETQKADPQHIDNLHAATDKTLAAQKLQSDAADKQRAYDLDLQKLYLDERRLALEERKVALDEQTAQVDAANVQRDAAFAAKNAENDFALKTAAQNSQIMDAQGKTTGTPTESVLAPVLKTLQDQHAAHMAHLDAMNSAHADQMAALAKSLSAPKRIVKDAGGRPVGVETVQ